MRVDSGSSMSFHYEAIKQSMLFAAQSQSSTDTKQQLATQPVAPPPSGGDTQSGAVDVRPSRVVGNANEPLSAIEKLAHNILQSLFSRVFGDDFKLSLPSDLTGNANPSGLVKDGGGESKDTGSDPTGAPAPNDPTATAQPENLLAYDYQNLQYAKTSLAFKAEGVIETGDGQSLNFSVALHASHEVYSANRLSAAAQNGDSEPLKVSYEGAAAEITTTQFEFHLDLAGNGDQVAVGQSAGTGNAEPAETTANETGTDESQSPGNKLAGLRVFSRDHHGRDKLQALGLKNGGGVFLGHLEDRFARQSGDGTKGQGPLAGLFDRVKQLGQLLDSLDFVA